MMKTVLRSLAAILAGLLAFFVVVVLVELFSAVVHPLPENFGHTMEEMCRHVERYPQWILAVVVPLWAGAAFAATWVAQRIGNLYSSAVVGLLVLTGLGYNLAKLPYPTWFKVVNLVVIPLALLAGVRLATRSRRKAAVAGEIA